MDALLYFKTVSMAWGALTVLRGPLVQLLGRMWPRLVSDVAWPKERPFWIRLAALLTVVVVAVTWWVYAKQKAPVPGSFWVTALITLSVFRASQVLFNYARCRRVVIGLTFIRPRLLAALNAASLLIGLALILLGVFVCR